MAKRLVFLIASLMVPVFIGGCPGVEPELAEPAIVGPARLEPAEPEPNQVEPVHAEPNAIAPAVPEPNDVEVGVVEPNEPEAPQIEPNETTLAVPEPNDIEVSIVEPNEPELPQIEPNETTPAVPEPNDIEVSIVEPNEPELPQIEPNETTLAVPEPNDIEVGVPEPNELELPDAEPNETTPAVPEPNDIEVGVPEPNEPELPQAEPNDVELEGPETTNAEPNEPKPDPATAFHDKCADILKKSVSETGMVDYQALRGKRHELRAMLEEFNRLDQKDYKSWSKEDRIAFWINVYNLQKLRIVTDNYPIRPSSRIDIVRFWGTSSIRHIEQKITKHKFLVMDEEWTFATIEKRFFRGEFEDPRIFFAISDACLSSPPLRNKPYYGRKLSEQLDDQTKKFLSGPRAFRVDREKQTVYLSARFQSSWHGKEFIKKFAIDRKFKDQTPETRAVLNFISNYVSEQEASFLEVGNYTIKYMKYDWTINDGS